MHAPFHSREAISKTLRLVRETAPDAVVQVGDLYDNFNWSRFYKSPDIISPRKELDQARSFAERFWNDVKRAAPRTKRFQLSGNHDQERLEKLSLTAAPALSSMVQERAAELMTFDGVETLYDYRDYLPLRVNGETINFCHGFLSHTISHVEHYNRSVVCGHLHRASIDYVTRGGRTLFGLNVGWTGNERKPVFNYTKSTVKNWTVGLGLLDERGPRFIRLSDL